MMAGRFNGKVMVVTAAGQGIGRAIAERLIAEGATVHASDLNGGLLDDLNAASCITLDATDRDAVHGYLGAMDQLDGLVHAVGYVHQGTIEECSPDDWQRSLTITLTSAYNVIGGAVPQMKAKGGSIVAIASVASSIKGFPRRVAYGASKAGVIGLVKAVAADHIGQAIRCNAVCPGTVNSPSLNDRIAELAQTMGSREKAMSFFIDRQPAGRFGEAAEVAALCAFLCSDEGAFVNGQAINIDGGITI